MTTGPSSVDSATTPPRVGAIGYADIGAVVVALLAYAFVHGGLFYEAFLPAVQIGLIVGVITALVASSASRSALAAGIGVALGALVEAPLHASGGALVLAATAIAVAALTAFAIRFAADKGQVRAPLVLLLGVLLIVGNLWLTTATMDANQVVANGQTMFQFMTTRPATGVVQADQQYYLAVIDHMKDGLPYYQAVKVAYHENALWGFDPPNVLAVRQPLLLWTLAKLPGDGRSPIWAMALIASVAGVLAMAISRDVEQRTVRLIALAAVAAYFVNFTTLPFVLGFEPWGGAFAVICAGLFALSLGDGVSPRRHYGYMAAAALVAVAAVAIRELMLFLPAAGLLAAFFSESRFRRFDIGAWIASIAGCAAVLGAHVILAGAIVTPRTGLEKWLGRGGVGNVVMGIVNGARYISASQWVLVALAIVGIVGAFVQRDTQLRVFLLVSIALPLAFFLVAWNGAIDQATGKEVNYWGSVISPLLFALVPAALGPLLSGRLVAALQTPGTAPTRPDEDEYWRKS
jgi:hypothetical protein